jgi:hypothetical protein
MWEGGRGFEKMLLRDRADGCEKGMARDIGQRHFEKERETVWRDNRWEK